MSWTNFDVQISTSNNAPGSLNNFLGENIGDDAITVRDGPMTFLPDVFPGGATPNEFGVEIPFRNTFTYTGGDLLVTIRHTGNGGSQALLDAVPDTPGQVEGIWAQSEDAYTALNANSGGFVPVTRFAFNPPVGYSYTLWNNANFTPVELADPAISGPMADPEKDLIPNLLEFLFGLDPHVANEQPWQQSVETVGANQFLQISFEVPADFPEDATLIVEESQSLGSNDPWVPIARKEGTNAWVAGPETVLTQSPVENGRITITVRSPNAFGNPHQQSYLRFRGVVPSD